MPEGATPAEACGARSSSRSTPSAWGYTRFWLAEHHNMVGVASAATSVVIGYIAGGTRTIRVGAGGIMLPNHSPLVIAEQFGTLESLYPGRIDLGLGRAPGTDQRTLRALRRDPMSAESFPQDVLELQALFGPRKPGQAVRGRAGHGTRRAAVDSGLEPVRRAARRGARVAVRVRVALRARRARCRRSRRIARSFRPSAQLAAPYAMVGANVVVAATDAEARRLFTSVQQGVTNLLRGARGRLQPPIDDIETYWTPAEKAQASRMLACSFVGSPATVRARARGVRRATTGADELIVAAGIFDQAARLRSYELLAEVCAGESTAVNVRRSLLAARLAGGRAALRRSRDPSRSGSGDPCATGAERWRSVNSTIFEPASTCTRAKLVRAARDETRPVLADAHRCADGARVRRRIAARVAAMRKNGADLVERRRAELALVVAGDRHDEHAGFRPCA